MINILDIYTQINELLITKYPNYEVYGQEVTQGMKTPSFFVSFTPKTISNETYNYQKESYTADITYFQKKVDEIDNMKKIIELKQLFGMNFGVLDRVITISDFSYQYVGTKNNILQFSFDFEYWNKIERIEDHDTAGELIINQTTV